MSLRHGPHTSKLKARTPFDTAVQTLCLLNLVTSVVPIQKFMTARRQLRWPTSLLQGAGEATPVRSMQDRHLLFQGLPGAHSTPKKGWYWNKDSRRLVKRTQKHESE
jgi:hypothetical protein